MCADFVYSFNSINSCTAGIHVNNIFLNIVFLLVFLSEIFEMVILPIYDVVIPCELFTVSHRWKSIAKYSKVGRGKGRMQFDREFNLIKIYF